MFFIPLVTSCSSFVKNEYSSPFCCINVACFNLVKAPSILDFSAFLLSLIFDIINVAIFSTSQGTSLMYLIKNKTVKTSISKSSISGLPSFACAIILTISVSIKV